MTIHHDKPVGVDIFFREIFAGDTVRDQDGKEYTIDERGWARPFDGSAGCGFKRLKEPVFVKAADKPEAPAKFQEKDGKVGPVVPVDVPKPEPRVRLAPIAKEFGFSTWQASKKVEESGLPTFGKGGLIYILEKDIPAVREALKPGCEPVAQLETQPEPAVEYREGPAPHRGGRTNKSGFSQLGNLAGRVGLTVNDARKICEDAGIEVVSYGKNHKAHVRVEDMPKVRELLTKAAGREPAPGNNGNHRPNTTGFSSFANLARGLHAKAWELRDFAKAHDIVIVRPDKPHSNDGIYKEDEVRFRELWAVEHGAAAPDQSDIKVQGKEDLLTIPLTDEDVMKEVALRNLWDRVLERYPGFIEAISKPVKVEETSDQYLADELRRRGYEVIAIKHVEL